MKAAYDSINSLREGFAKLTLIHIFGKYYTGSIVNKRPRCAAAVISMPKTTNNSAMKLSSTAFAGGDKIPSRYTCDGNNFSPPLLVKDVHPGASSLALTVEDPDAPGGVFVHWIIWNIPASIASIPEHLPTTEVVNSFGGAKQGVNDFGDVGYGGPCPPRGPPHKIHFHVVRLGQGACPESRGLEKGTRPSDEKAYIGRSSIDGKL